MRSRKKLYRGRGLGLASGPHMPILALKNGSFTTGKWRIYREGRIRVRTDLRPGPGEASGGSPESFGDLRSGRKVIKIDEFGVFSWGKEGSAYIEPTREKSFFAKLRERE